MNQSFEVIRKSLSQLSSFHRTRLAPRCGAVLSLLAAVALVAMTPIIVRAQPTTLAASDKPNVIVIFADDQGYNDLGCFGSPNIRTPHIDRLAAQGIKFTDFYSAASVCTPSRAALLTGCYPERVGNLPVLFPNSDRGLNPDEVTIAEALKSVGYHTACVGKWHLGHLPEFLPIKQGFDSYYGIPYSNDMGADGTMKLAANVSWRQGQDELLFKAQALKEPPLFRNDEVIEFPADQSLLSERYTNEAIRFIKQHRDGPFFLYLPHTMPHIPLFASRRFDGASEAGLYGDTLEEIDWSVGQIVKTLRELDIEQNTLIVYTSDNGPWNLKGSKESKVKGNQNRRVGGSAYPLRGFKFQKWEGGMRVPCVMSWPGHIPAGQTCTELAGTIDILPTVAELAGVRLDPSRKIDGKSITGLLLDPTDATTPHDVYFYRTQGVRSGQWKLINGELYDLANDVSESKNVADAHPDIVARLQDALDAHKADLKSTARPAGTAQRPAQKVGGLSGWNSVKGIWKVDHQIIRQSVVPVESALLSPPIDATAFRLTLQARVTSGEEGFRISVLNKNVRNGVRWSLGAFRNTQHSLMAVRNGRVGNRSPSFKAALQPDQWYSLRIDVNGGVVQTYVDGKLTSTLTSKRPQGKLSIGLGSNRAAVEFKEIIVRDLDNKILLVAPDKSAE